MRTSTTPAVNAAVVPPADSVPVDVMVAVRVNPVTVLLFASRAVILMLNAVPAVCVPMAPPPAVSTRKLFSTPGFTVIGGLVLRDLLPFVIDRQRVVEGERGGLGGRRVLKADN